MANDLAYYRDRFRKLKSDIKPYWPEVTLHRAPHKPFLLLSIMDLIAQGVISSNFIELNANVTDIFDLYWGKLMGQDREGSPLLPFYHMKSEGFWHLMPVPGMEQALANVGRIRSLRQLSQLVLGVKLDNELFDLLMQAQTRDDLRRVLIETYFTPETRPVLVEVGQICAESFDYSRELLNRLRDRFKLQEAPEVDEHYRTESRSTAFRRIVVDAYNHTCAMCGIRLLTPEGRTAVAAAHIVPWRVSHNDDPRNGLALCGLHHWTFDQGMVGVTADYHMIVSPAVEDEVYSRPLLDLSNRELRLPNEPYLWPAKQALRWHRENVFRADVPLRLL